MSGFYDDQDYEIGYKKPPKNSQFKKGKSGNPKGRPPKKIFHETFCQVINEDVTITLNGEKVALPLKEAILRKMLIDSLNGKPQATKNFIEVMKHLTAMPPI